MFGSTYHPGFRFRLAFQALFACWVLWVSHCTAEAQNEASDLSGSRTEEITSNGSEVEDPEELRMSESLFRLRVRRARAGVSLGAIFGTLSLATGVTIATLAGLGCLDEDDCSAAGLRAGGAILALAGAASLVGMVLCAGKLRRLNRLRREPAAALASW